MKQLLCTALMCLSLCACQQEEDEPFNPIADRLQASEEAQCREMGFRPGNKDYSSCLLQLRIADIKAAKRAHPATAQ